MLKESGVTALQYTALSVLERRPTMSAADLADPEALRLASTALQGAELTCDHFSSVRKRAQAGHFVYFDPPYVPMSTTAYFTSYTRGNFGDDDQRAFWDGVERMGGPRRSPGVAEPPIMTKRRCGRRRSCTCGTPTAISKWSRPSACALRAM